MTEFDIEKVIREIWEKKDALEENLIKTDDVQSLFEKLLRYLKLVLPHDSIHFLRMNKKIALKRNTFWSDQSGYPPKSEWKKFVEFMDFYFAYKAEKTIKDRLEIDNLFVEVRSQNEDEHIIVGNRDGSGAKAHIVIDGKTAEIRVEDGTNRLEPAELLKKIETVLTLNDGRKILTTRGFVDFIK